MSDGPWLKMVAPIVAKCELAAKLELNAKWNPDGARALGELIRRMAEALDVESDNALDSRDG